MKISAPQTEAQIATANLIAVGEYPFAVLEATDTVSKGGNEMIKLKINVYESDDRARHVYDYLVDIESMAYKVRHFAESIGKLAEYEAGNMPADGLVGCSGTCKIAIDSKDPAYPAKNIVRDYVPPAAADGLKAPKVTRAPKTKAAPAEIIDDSIPF